MQLNKQIKSITIPDLFIDNMCMTELIYETEFLIQKNKSDTISYVFENLLDKFKPIELTFFYRSAIDNSLDNKNDDILAYICNHRHFQPDDGTIKCALHASNKHNHYAIIEILIEKYELHHKDYAQEFMKRNSTIASMIEKKRLEEKLHNNLPIKPARGKNKL